MITKKILILMLLVGSVSLFATTREQARREQARREQVVIQKLRESVRRLGVDNVGKTNNNINTFQSQGDAVVLKYLEMNSADINLDNVSNNESFIAFLVKENRNKYIHCLYDPEVVDNTHDYMMYNEQSYLYGFSQAMSNLRKKRELDQEGFTD